MKRRINALVTFLIFRWVLVTSKADHTENVVPIETDQTELIARRSKLQSGTLDNICHFWYLRRTDIPENEHHPAKKTLVDKLMETDMSVEA